MPKPMTTDDIWNELLKATTDYNGSTTQLTRETSLRDALGFDSLNAVEFCMAVEDAFGISITEEEQETLNTLGDYLNIIKTKKGINDEH